METISADLPAFTESENSNLILVVDDNPFNRIFLSEILKELNFSVIEVINGSEAIEYVKKHDFYLIFMDMLMPGINGFEATKKIRSMGILTPVIAISAMNAMIFCQNLLVPQILKRY
ncbi:MAG: hypothetical protein B6I31_01385 [Desulfobacteraceae bacterium 4572_19]|nr:MAG: hypothetical protein B6I31_01385 [Desulfobacteraceae bacterium 4572_19]